MEENLMEKFQEKLKELLVIAKKKKNVLEYSEITDLFSDMNLTAEQMDSILEYLEKNNIDTLRTTDDDEEPDPEEAVLDEEDIDNIILGKNTGYMQELKERVREVTIGYVTELLGTFRELGIDFRTTQTVFMGGGAILVSEIIKVVWERFKGEYFIINDPKANAKGYKLQFQIEAKERED